MGPKKLGERRGGLVSLVETLVLEGLRGRAGSHARRHSRKAGVVT